MNALIISISIFYLVSCSPTQDNATNIVNIQSSKSIKQDNIPRDTPSKADKNATLDQQINQKNKDEDNEIADSTESKSIRDIRLKWKDFPINLSFFSGTIEHFSHLSENELLLCNTESHCLLLNTENNSYEKLPDVDKSKPEEKMVFLGKNISWNITSESIRRIEKIESSFNMDILEFKTNKIFGKEISGTVQIRSPRRDSIVLENNQAVLQLSTKNNSYKVISISGENIKDAAFSPFGVPFLFKEKSILEYYIGSQTREKVVSNLIHQGLPEKIEQIKIDLSGTEQAPQLWGIAQALGKFWITSGTVLETQPINQIQAVHQMPSDTFEAQVSPLLLKYCSGCHEGRKPAFVKNNGKTIDKNVVIAAAKEIKTRITLPKDHVQIMPQYAPFPDDSELKIIVEWLENSSATNPN